MANEDAGNAPLDPGPSSGQRDAAQLDALEALKKEVNAINRSKESSNTLDTNRNALARAYVAAMEEVAESHKKIEAIQLGLEGKYRTEGARLSRSVEDNVKLMSLAEKYLYVQEKTNKLAQERANIQEGIRLAADKMGMSDLAYQQAIDRADRGIKKQATEESIAGWTNMISKVGSAIDYQFQSQMIGAMGRGRTLMQGGNVAGASIGGANNLANSLFGATGSAMNPLERMAALNKILEESPVAANQSASAMKNMIGTMAFFGANTDKMVATLIKGSREAGMNANDIAKIYSVANMSARELGLSTMETSDNLLALAISFRQVGGGINQASAVMNMFSKGVRALGVDLTGTEKLELASKFVQGISSLPFDKMAGLTMFATGKSASALTEGDMSSPLKTAMSVFQKISSQVGPGFVNQGAAAQKTAELLGMHLNELQTVELSKILKQGGHADEKAFDRLADPTRDMAQGIHELAATIDPLKSIDNTTKNIQGLISQWGAAITSIQGIVPALVALRFVGGAQGIAGGLGTAAATTASALGLGETAEVAGMGAAAAFGAAPALVTLGVVGVGAAAYYGAKYLQH